MTTDKQDVISMVENGFLDDGLIEIRNAIQSRLDERRGEILKLVKDVYGEGADIVLKR